MSEERGGTGAKALPVQDNGVYDDPLPPPPRNPDVPWAGDTRIWETPGVCGGYPCIGRTRITVRNIVVVHKETNEDFEQTVEMYPQLTREQVQAALDYYAAHPVRVDEDIERNARTLAELKGQRWPVSE